MFNKKTGSKFYYPLKELLKINQLKYYSASTASPSKVKVSGTLEPFGETLTYPCIS